MKYLDVLNQAQKDSHCSLMWDRIDDSTIVFSTSGYKHAEHSLIEKALLKTGCRYSFEEGHHLQYWDRTCGRTWTHMKVPTKSN